MPALLSQSLAPEYAKAATALKSYEEDVILAKVQFRLVCTTPHFILLVVRFG